MLSIPQIVVTLGPSSLTKHFLININQYPNVYLLRINLSHTLLEDVSSTIDFIKEYTNIPICLDSEGAQIRCQRIKNNETCFKKGSIVKVHFKEILGDKKNISFSPIGIVSQFKVGDIINIDFDGSSILLREKRKNYFLSEVINEGIIKSNRATNIDRKINLLSITKKDKRAFEIGREKNIKHYALSFAYFPDDIHYIRSKISKGSLITSKIESIGGLKNLDEIIKVSDDILIDRGDLSREVPIEIIPFLQQIIIQRTLFFNKPVMVATNLLEGMVKHSCPTRAEINDVISLLKSGTSRLVLAAETAVGKDPLQTVKMAISLINNFLKWKNGTKISDILCFLKEIKND